jgi:hypothetical protein
MKYWEIDFVLDYIQKNIALNQSRELLKIVGVDEMVYQSDDFIMGQAHEARYKDYLTNPLTTKIIKDIELSNGVSVNEIFNEIKSHKLFSELTHTDKSRLGLYASSLNLHSSRFLKMLDKIDDYCDSLSPKRRKIFDLLQKQEYDNKLNSANNQVISFITRKNQELELEQVVNGVEVKTQSKRRKRLSK